MLDYEENEDRKIMVANIKKSIIHYKQRPYQTIGINKISKPSLSRCVNVNRLNTLKLHEIHKKKPSK